MRARPRSRAALRAWRVVFKQWVQLALYPGKQTSAGGPNEWRLWFCRGELLSMHPNSFQSDAAPPPPAASVDSLFFAVDLAEREDGEWICLESNDGGASGPAPEQDLVEFCWFSPARRSAPTEPLRYHFGRGGACAEASGSTRE